jgi:hypothetical protein
VGRTVCGQVLDLIGEATQSRRLVLGSTPTPVASQSMFGGAPNEVSRCGSDGGPLMEEPVVKGLSLILFDEADVVFEDDSGFEAAVQSLIETAKCPIILTCHRTSPAPVLAHAHTRLHTHTHTHTFTHTHTHTTVHDSALMMPHPKQTCRLRLRRTTR